MSLDRSQFKEFKQLLLRTPVWSDVTKRRSFLVEIFWKHGLLDHFNHPNSSDQAATELLQLLDGWESRDVDGMTPACALLKKIRESSWASENQRDIAGKLERSQTVPPVAISHRPAGTSHLLHPTGALTATGGETTPFLNSDLIDALSQQIAKNFARIREQYLRGEKAAAIAELNDLLKEPSWQHLTPGIRGRILRTAALYRLDFDHDQAEAEALAKRAAEENSNGDDQALAAHLTLERGDRQGALALLEEPRSLQARHLRAAILIEEDDADAALRLLSEPPPGPAEDNSYDLTSSADTTDAEGNTAETWRLRAMAHLAQKHLPEAIEAIDKARALAADWNAVHSAAAIIDFWRACTPAALRLTEQPLWPMPFSPGLVRADANASLLQVEQEFAKVAESMPVGSGEQRHWLTWRLIALLATGDWNAAKTLGKQLLGEEGPLHIWSLLWVRFFNLDMDRERIKERLRTIPADDPNFIPLTGLYLALRLEDGEAEAVLTELDELTLTVETLGHPEAARQWRVLALTAAERFDEAEEVVAAIEEEDQRLRLVLHIARNQEKEAPDRHKAAASALFAIDQSLDVLAEACDAHAAANDWAFVAVHADTLLEAIPTPHSLRLLAFSSFNQGDYQRCMTALDEHRDVYPDGGLPKELARLRVRCQRMLGESSEAAQAAYRLWQEAPTAEHLRELIECQIQGGDLPGACKSLRRMLGTEEGSAESLLHGVELAVMADDQELAVLLWRRAGEVNSDAADFSAWMATAGNRLGLGKETAPWFERMAADVKAGIGSTRAVQIPEMLERMRKQREAGEHLEESYRTGQIPVHLLPGHLFPPLSRLFHELPERNRRDCDPLVARPILIRHGARPLSVSRDDVIQGGRLVLDITAVFTAYDLGLLDAVENHLAPLWLTPDWHPVLLDEIRRLSPNQPDRIEAQRRVADLVRANGIARVDLESLPPPSEHLTESVGEHNARGLERARAEVGCLVEYLPLNRLEQDNVTPVQPPPDWSGYLISPRGLLDQAAEAGVIDSSAYRRAMEHFSSEPDGATAMLRPGDFLLVCSEILISLAQADVLSALAQGYRLAVENDFWLQIDAELSQNNVNAELIAKLRELIERLNTGFQAGTYKNAPIGGPADDMASQPTHGLEGLLRFPGEPGDLLWIDDRLLSSYRRSGACQIIGIVDVLGKLRHRKAITKVKYFDWLAQLRASNYRYIPLSAEEILYWLAPGRANSNADRLIVPPQLECLAHYWAACLFQGESLQWAGNERHPQGELSFFVASQSAVGKVLWTIWSDDRLNRRRQLQRADWVLDNLYVGVGDIPHLVSASGPEHDMNRVGMDLAGFLFGAFQVVFEHVERRREQKGRRPANNKRADEHALHAAEDYLHWISEKVIAPRLLADPASLGPTVTAFRALLLGKPVCENEGLSRLFGAWLLRFLPILPSELRQELHKDQDLMQKLGLEQVTLIEVNGLHFSPQDLWPAVEKTLSGISPLIMDSRGEQPFRLALVSSRDAQPSLLEFTDADDRLVGRSNLVFSELLYDSREQRIEALRANPHWRDGDLRNIQEIERDLSAIDSAWRRIEAVRRMQDRSADAHYIEFENDWRRSRSFSLDRCYPPPLSAVLTYMRREDASTSGESLSQQCWEKLVHSIPSERGLVEPLHRVALLPSTLPNGLRDSISVLDTEPLRDLLKGLAIRLTDPIGRLHLIDLMLNAAEKLPEVLPLVQEQINDLSTPKFAEQVDLTRALVDLSYRAFGTDADEAGVSHHQQLLAAWAHAGRVAGILLRGGVAPGELARRLRQWNLFTHRDLYTVGLEPAAGLAWPSHVEVADLLFSGVGRILNRYPERASQLDLSILQQRLARLEVGDPQSKGDWHLIRDTALLTDALGCLWGGDRSISLAPLIGEQKANRFAPAAFASLVDGLLEELAGDASRAEHWRSLFFTIQRGRLPTSKAERLGGILRDLDVEALSEANPHLLIPVMTLMVRYGDDRESIEALLYRWAAGIDKGAQPSPAVREDLGDDAARTFSGYLLDWLNSLAVRHPEDPDGEFACLLEGVIERSRILAEELRGLLLGITRHLPYPRHRALRRTLLAARARPGLAGKNTAKQKRRSNKPSKLPRPKKKKMQRLRR